MVHARSDAQTDAPSEAADATGNVSAAPGGPQSPAVVRIGCVSYLNSKPLIDGLKQGQSPGPDRTGHAVRFDVPSRLLDDLETGRVDLALCPVIDYHRARTPLVVVPAGGIASDGATLTVRLFSQVPFDQVEQIHADTDSHTSVVLARLVLEHVYRVRPVMVDFDAREQVAGARTAAEPATVLLIGDKVVTGTSAAHGYPHQLDLGEAWRGLTGLPFVFAIWMARQGAALGAAPALLEQTRRRNETEIDRIVDKYAASHGWPVALARSYLADHLKFAIGPRETEAMQTFANMAYAAGLIAQARPLHLWEGND